MKHLTMEAMGWLLVAFSKDVKAASKEINTIKKHIMSNVTETAETANFITSYGQQHSAS